MILPVASCGPVSASAFLGPVLISWLLLGAARAAGSCEEGYCEHLYGNGDRYSGLWQGGKRHGLGNQSYASGHSYHGNWSFDQRWGLGAHHWPDGMRYYGQWQEDERQGLGVNVWPDKSRYEGTWKADVMNGPGVYTFQQPGEGVEPGRRYIGEWLNDKIHGCGQIVEAADPDGENPMEGHWKDNELDSSCTEPGCCAEQVEAAKKSRKLARVAAGKVRKATAKAAGKTVQDEL
eukprot:TRINITY_DN103722_c0_g1_i1.p1 TRINITY_DN103722_c0_g1~~TRINITY_DN103722_c0_g1_i1.p1  ORF type:complete len:234 (-),score=42.57 TRINITY_DN103722_c0_g1_i1:20-721(-)